MHYPNLFLSICSAIENLGTVPALLHLHLPCHSIASITPVLACSALQTLNLADNEISHLGSLLQLPKLEEVDVSGNRLTCVPQQHRKQARIHTLKLARNRLASVSDLEHLRALINLSALTLDGNPLAAQEHTRSYAIFRLRSLDTLDTAGITAGEPNLIYPNLSNLI